MAQLHTASSESELMPTGFLGAKVPTLSPSLVLQKKRLFLQSKPGRAQVFFLLLSKSFCMISLLFPFFFFLFISLHASPSFLEDTEATKLPARRTRYEMKRLIWRHKKINVNDPIVAESGQTMDNENLSAEWPYYYGKMQWNGENHDLRCWDWRYKYMIKLFSWSVLYKTLLLERSASTMYWTMLNEKIRFRQASSFATSQCDSRFQVSPFWRTTLYDCYTCKSYKRNSDCVDAVESLLHDNQTSLTILPLS